MTLTEKGLVLRFIYPNRNDFYLENETIKCKSAGIKMPTDEEYLTIFESSEFKNRDAIRENKQIHNELGSIDLKSIRSLREWIAEQPGAPKFIKDYEKEAKDTRKKLKPLT